MGIVTRPKFLAQQRFDLEDIQALQSAQRTDSLMWIQQFVTGTNHVVKGFNVTGIGLNAATIGMTDATFVIPQSTTDFSYFIAESGVSDITVTDAELTDNARNYIELVLATEDNTPVVKAFWDPSANSGDGAEFSQSVNTMTDLNISVAVEAGGFTGSADRIPLAIIDTDVSGVIKIILDRRDRLYRLGTGTDPSNTHTWGSQEEPVYSILTTAAGAGAFTVGEIVTFSSGATATVVTDPGPGASARTITVRLPSNDNMATADSLTGADSGSTSAVNTILEAFTGADKDIDDQRKMNAALMTEILALKGTDFWHQAITGSISGIVNMLNSLVTAETNSSKWSWDGSSLSLSNETREVTDVTTVNAAALDGTYMIAYDDVGSVGFWFDVDNSGTAEPGHGAARGVEISTVITGNTDAEVAEHFRAVVDADSKFSAVLIAPNQVRITASTVGTKTDATAGTSGFTVTVSTQGAAAADADVLANLRIFGSSQDIDLTRQDGAGGSAAIAIADGEVMFVQLPATGDRVFSGAGAGSTNFQVSAFATFTQSDQNYWLAFRENGKLYVRGYGELESGESAQIGDPITSEILTYIGASDETDSTPSYGSTNYVTQGNPLNQAITELDNQAGVKQLEANEDRNTKLIEGGTWDWVQSTGVLTWSASAFLSIAGFAEDVNEISTGSDTLAADGDCSYVTIKRTAGASTLTVNTAAIASVPQGDDTFIFARRVGNTVIIGDSVLLADNESSSIYNSKSNFDVQDNNIKLIEGGTWDWDLATSTLSWDAATFLQIPGLANNVNEISIGSDVLADGECSYVSIKRTAGVSTLTVNTAAIASVPDTDDIFIIARRIGSIVIIGTGSDALADGEFLTLDGQLAEINRLFGQLQIEPHPSNGDRVVVTGADISMLDGSTLSQSVNNLLMSFDGAEIDFSTGNVYEDDGSTPLGTNNTFSVIDPVSADDYMWYSITLLADVSQADLSTSVQLLVTPNTIAPLSAATSAAAKKPPLSSSGTPLGFVYTQDDGSDTQGNILTIDKANIRQLGVGGGGGAGGVGQDGINYITNPTVDSNTAGFSTYDDGASATPVDGTGGSPTVTLSHTTVEATVIRGDGSLLFTLPNSDAQGEGYSTDFPIDNADKDSKTLNVSFEYYNTNTADLQVFVYDIDNTTLLGAVLNDDDGYLVNTVNDIHTFNGRFYTTDSGNYRLIVHMTTTDAVNATPRFDNFKVGPDVLTPGFIGDEWHTDWTPTGAWSTNVTWEGKWRRVGDSMEVDALLIFTGAPNATGFTMTLPDSLAIDTSKMNTDTRHVGNAYASIAAYGSTGLAIGSVVMNSTTAVEIKLLDDASASNNNLRSLTYNDPAVIANGDRLSLRFTVPIDGWPASALVSTTENFITTTRVEAGNNSGQSINNATQTTITNWTEEIDNLNSFNATTGVWTATKSGTINIAAMVTFNANATGFREITIRKNSTGIVFKDLGPHGTISDSLNISANIDVTRGDTIDIQVYQSSGGALLLRSDARTNRFSIHYVGDKRELSVFGETELVEASAALASWTPGAGVWTNLTTISLPSGEWDISADLVSDVTADGNAGVMYLAISENSGTTTTDHIVGDNEVFQRQGNQVSTVGTNTAYITESIPRYRVIVTSAKTYYLKAKKSDGTLNQRIAYKISARRIK